MTFDSFAVAAMAAELRQTILNGRVQRVVQVNSLTYGLEIFVHPTRHYLLISVEPQAPRLHLSAEKTRRGMGNETPLMLVLRKYLRGARLKSIDQPAYERILYFPFLSPFGPVSLAVEMLGTRSNLVLMEADRSILGAARLSKPEEGRSGRVILPNFPYLPPPPQDKLTPPELTEAALRQELAEASPELPLARLLPGIVRGVSPFLAREIVYRACGRTDVRAGELSDVPALLSAFGDLLACLRDNRWTPTLALDESGQPVAFAPYPLHHLGPTRHTGSFSEAVETYFAGVAAGYAAAKAPLHEAIQAARERLARRRERLQQDAAAHADPDLLRQKGEAVLAYAHQIQPGQTRLSVPWGMDGEMLTIELEPDLSPAENARRYFQQYRKAGRAGEEIPAQLARVEMEEAYLEQLAQDLDMAEDRPEIEAVAAALAEAGFIRPGGRKRASRLASRFLRLTAPDGATVWVGKNAAQNAHLTFKQASPDDLWLHARGIPGAHVVIPTAEGLPSEEDVLWAAGVAAYYSRGRHDTAVEVDVTLKKYVRAIKGAPAGLVTYRNETTLRVAPLAPDIE